MPTPAIQVASVVKRYDGRTILDRIVLDVMEGETLVILGGSGSGKSTLLRLMIGNVRPDAGDILVRDAASGGGGGGGGGGTGQKNICAMTPAELDAYRRCIGVLFQSGALYNSMSVAD